MAGNGVPGAVGQGRVALLPGLEVPRINGARKIRQGFGSRSQGELDGSGSNKQLFIAAFGKCLIF